jgi:hypothetical protein
MTHARQQIREAVATILSRSPVAWKTVLKQRKEPDRVLWPYLMVFAESDQSQPTTVSDPCVYGRELTLTVAGMLRLPGTGDTYTIEDKFDAMSVEIETKLTQSALRAEVPQVQSLSLASTSLEVVEEDEGIYHGEVITSWRIGYSTEEGSPETLI